MRRVNAYARKTGANAAASAHLDIARFFQWRLEFTSPWLHAAAAAVLALAAYCNSLPGGFHLDDWVMLEDEQIRGAGPVGRVFRLEQTRPLTYLTFRWNFSISETDPWPYHAANVALHTGNSALLLFVARCALPPAAAFGAAAIFAVHPIHSEAVNYVFQRATLLATFFALLTVLLYFHGKWLPSAVAFGLSLLAKEETIALPVWLLLHALMLRKERPIRWGYFAAMFCLSSVAAARIWYALSVTPDPNMGYGMEGMTAITYLLTQTRVVWTYIALFFWPAGLNLDHDVELSQSLTTPWTTLPAALALVVVVLVFSRQTLHGRRGPAVWLLGFFVLLAPSSSLVPVADVMFEHRTYFPLTCFVVGLGWLWGKFSRPIFWMSAAVVLPVLLWVTIARNRTWKDEESLWTDATAKSPRKARPYVHLARAVSARQPDRSVELLQKALAIDPKNADAHSHLGMIRLLNRQPAEAIRHYRQAIASAGETAVIWNNMGLAHAALGLSRDAVADYRSALRLDPCLAGARLNLIALLAATGEKKEALLASQAPPVCRLSPSDALELETLRRRLY